MTNLRSGVPPQVLREVAVAPHPFPQARLDDGLGGCGVRGDNAVHAFLDHHAFARKHQDKIQGVLSGFDRVIFRGYLPICHVGGLHGWLRPHRVIVLRNQP